ncbi:spore germination protein [Oscillospiraceae bacterium MB08-C2-2]|nr:spore germination protein [Oscillospiraceae bacterium MB08-C2-2]
MVENNGSALCLEQLKKELEYIYDVQYRELLCRSVRVTLVYVQSMCDSRQISEFIIRPLYNKLNRLHSLRTIAGSIIQAGMVVETRDLDTAISSVLSGQVLVVFHNHEAILTCDMKKYERRSVEIPQTETVIKGPREGFSEDININISEIRRRIKSPLLKMERYSLGEQSKTEAVLVYIKGTTPDKLIAYAREKINLIREDYVFYPTRLENALKCKTTSFDTIGYTEKPDVASSKLVEGRILILLDGNPFVITAPNFFIEAFQTTDDYTLNPVMANMGRLFRWISFFMALFVPGLYLALVTYHFKLVPNIFLYRLALFRAGVPVPTVIELLYMVLFFQIIREAGVRLPQPIGPTLSIVGALILGDAAVTSGLASQITVVVVAITSIASYLIPVMHGSIFLWSLCIVLFSSMLGLPGFYMGGVLFISHLAGLTSCGYPYLYPFGTEKTFKYQDIFIKGTKGKQAGPPLKEDR